MATHSNGISALQLQSQLSLDSYRTAWMLAAKLRRAMVNPERERLSGLVEADETIIPFRTKNDQVVVPAGRSGVGKMLVAGAVEIDGGKPRRVRLKVIEDFRKQELHASVLGAVAPQTQLVTDDWPYHNLPGVRHNAITLGPMAAHIALHWIHRLFSNLKRWGLGVYHGLRKTNLQHYLDEFVFRFNRRRTRHAAFDTLLGIGARTNSGTLPRTDPQSRKPHSSQQHLDLEPPEARAEAINAISYKMIDRCSANHHSPAPNIWTPFKPAPKPSISRPSSRTLSVDATFTTIPLVFDARTPASM
jgi:hypothetical protein